MGCKKLLCCLSAQLRPPTITQHMDYIQVTLCLPSVHLSSTSCQIACVCACICSWSSFLPWFWAASLRQEPRTSRVRVDYNMLKEIALQWTVFLKQSLQIGLESSTSEGKTTFLSVAIFEKAKCMVNPDPSDHSSHRIPGLTLLMLDLEKCLLSRSHQLICWCPFLNHQGLNEDQWEYGFACARLIFRLHGSTRVSEVSWSRSAKPWGFSSLVCLDRIGWTLGGSKCFCQSQRCQVQRNILLSA